MNLFKNKTQFFLTLYFLGFFGWWLSFQSVVENQGQSVSWFLGTYGLIALVGAGIGIVTSKRWGGYRTVLGRALLFFSLGLLAQEAGQLTYQYYIYVSKISVPYPSLGDIAYFGSVLLYIYAAWLLAKASGVRFSLKHARYKLAALIIFGAIIGVSYWIFLFHHQYDFHKPITVLLDFGYPMGQAIYISLAVTAYLLSRKLLGGIMKPAIILIIFALIVQYVSDFTFLYQSSRGTWIAGKINDISYLFAYFVMSSALLQVNLAYKNLGKKSDKDD